MLFAICWVALLYGFFGVDPSVLLKEGCQVFKLHAADIAACNWLSLLTRDEQFCVRNISLWEVLARHLILLDVYDRNCKHRLSHHSFGQLLPAGLQVLACAAPRCRSDQEDVALGLQHQLSEGLSGHNRQAFMPRVHVTRWSNAGLGPRLARTPAHPGLCSVPGASTAAPDPFWQVLRPNVECREGGPVEPQRPQVTASTPICLASNEPTACSAARAAKQEEALLRVDRQRAICEEPVGVAHVEVRLAVEDDAELSLRQIDRECGDVPRVCAHRVAARRHAQLIEVLDLIVRTIALRCFVEQWHLQRAFEALVPSDRQAHILPLVGDIHLLDLNHVLSFFTDDELRFPVHHVSNDLDILLRQVVWLQAVSAGCILILDSALARVI
mmetsp:Transcript_145749/g.363433  ORF Transcript_145749/g.363433 Transcript_145749/m.363433 type:complete len:385 (+) Transcript_145749:1002-2156(+)